MGQNAMWGSGVQLKSTDGRWSTFVGQHSSVAERQCPERGTLVELPQLRDAERSRTRGCGHCCTLLQFGRTGRNNVGQSLARRPDERPIHVDDGIDQRGRFQEEVRRRRFARWPEVRAITRRHVIRRVGEQRSEFSSTRLELFDEASMQLVRCHSDPHRFSAEVVVDVHSASPIHPHLGRSG